MSKAFAFVAVVATITVAGPSVASGQTNEARSCDGKSAAHHVMRARAIIRAGHDEARYPDRSPMHGDEKRALRDHKFCLRVDDLRDRVATYRDRIATKYRRGLEEWLAEVKPWATAKAKALVASLAGWLASTRACESGGDYGAVDASGTYFGAYQFDFSTWASVGGSGSPAEASKAEQDWRAALLYQRRGSSPWPVCG